MDKNWLWRSLLFPSFMGRAWWACCRPLWSPDHYPIASHWIARLALIVCFPYWRILSVLPVGRSACKHNSSFGRFQDQLVLGTTRTKVGLKTHWHLSSSCWDCFQKPGTPVADFRGFLQNYRLQLAGLLFVEGRNTGWKKHQHASTNY
jgi:hypothetical protein